MAAQKNSHLTQETSVSSGTVETDGPNTVLKRLLAVPSSQGNEAPGETVDIQDYVPFPFVLGEDGISREKDDGLPEQICGPLLIYRLTRGATGQDFGFQIKGITLDNRAISLSVPASRLHGDPAELAKVMADRGIRIVPGKEKQVIAFLDVARAPACRRPWLIAQPRLGWADGNSAAFVFPECVVGEMHSVFQPDRVNRMAESCEVAGSLGGWQNRIASVAAQDTLAMFALCASFAAPLLRPANSDGFGFHLYGLTSRGKTTVLQLAASVWGRGADPGADGRAFCRRWNATGNALESLAEEHNDLLLPLDEVGTFRNPVEVGRAIYNIAGGRGAERLKSDGQRRAPREWRTLILSSGEISLGELMHQSGQHMKGGQAVRVMDIPFPRAGLFNGQELAGQTVRELKLAASECYGVAGRAFINWFVDFYGDHLAASQAIQERVSSCARALADGLSPELNRAAQRFALVQVAGELAAKAGILPYTHQQIGFAVRDIWNKWRVAMPDVDDGMRALRSIAEYIASHPGQFPSVDQEDRLPATVAGYYKNKEGEKLYLFTDDGLSLALGDISKTVALAALEDANWLFKNDSKRKKSKHHVRALGERMYFYAIRADGVAASAAGEGPVVSSDGAEAGQRDEVGAQGVAANVPTVPEEYDENPF